MAFANQIKNYQPFVSQILDTLFNKNVSPSLKTPQTVPFWVTQDKVEVSPLINLDAELDKLVEDVKALQISEKEKTM